MELFFIVLRNIAIFIAALYLLFVIVDVVFVVSFSSILANHDHDLFVILTNKKDNLSNCLVLLNKHKVKVDKKVADSLNNFDIQLIEHQDGEEARKARELLTLLSEQIMSVARDNPKVTEDEEFTLIETNVNELESVYRHHVVLYNADVLGYNFWISFFPTRYIYKILKRKHKNIIS